MKVALALKLNFASAPELALSLAVRFHPVCRSAKAHLTNPPLACAHRPFHHPGRARVPWTSSDRGGRRSAARRAEPLAVLTAGSTAVQLVFTSELYNGHYPLVRCLPI